MFGQILGQIPGQMSPIDLREPNGEVISPPAQDSNGLRQQWTEFQNKLKERPEILQAIAALGAGMMGPNSSRENFGQGIANALGVMQNAEKQRMTQKQMDVENKRADAAMGLSERKFQQDIKESTESRQLQREGIDLQKQKFTWDKEWDTKKWAQQLGLDQRRLALAERAAGNEEAVTSMRMDLLREQVQNLKDDNGRFKVDGTPAQMALAATANQYITANGLNKDDALVAAMDDMPKILPKVAKATGEDKDKSLAIATRIFGELNSNLSNKATPEENWATALKLVGEGKTTLNPTAGPTPEVGSDPIEAFKQKHPVGSKLTVGNESAEITGHDASGLKVLFNGKTKLVPWAKLSEVQ